MVKRGSSRRWWAGWGWKSSRLLARPERSLSVRPGSLLPLPHTRPRAAHALPLPPAMSAAGGTDGLNDVYEALERYSWGNDVEFQSGLSAILGSNSTPEQAAELALRARCFYYARYTR